MNWHLHHHLKNIITTNMHSPISLFNLLPIGKPSICLLHPCIAYYLLWEIVCLHHPLCNIKPCGWDSDCMTQVKVHYPVFPQLSNFWVEWFVDANIYRLAQAHAAIWNVQHFHSQLSDGRDHQLMIWQWYMSSKRMGTIPSGLLDMHGFRIRPTQAFMTCSSIHAFFWQACKSIFSKVLNSHSI